MGNFSHLRLLGLWLHWETIHGSHIPHQKCLVRKPEYLFQFFRGKRDRFLSFFPLRFEEMMWYIEKLLRIELFYVRNYTSNIFFAPWKSWPVYDTVTFRHIDTSNWNNIHISFHEWQHVNELKTFKNLSEIVENRSRWLLGKQLSHNLIPLR